MAGKFVANQIQVGDSATATQNFVIQTNVDGSGKLARGNAGATTQDIVTWDSNGKVLLPQSKGPAFRVYQTVAQSVPAVDTLLTMDTKDFDTALAFSTSTNRFQPLVAGYYQLNGNAQANGTTSNWYTALYKNGSVYQYGTHIPTSVSAPISIISALIFMNGTTDYVEFRAAGAAGITSNPGSARVTFAGFLAREA